MLFLQFCCVPHCNFDPLLSFYKNVSSIMVCVVQQQSSFSQFLITQTHLYASTSFPPQGGETVLIKQAQSLPQLFWLSFKSQPHQLNSCRDSDHIRSVRPSFDPGLGPGMSSVSSTDQSSVQPSYLNFRQICPCQPEAWKGISKETRRRL